MITSLKAIKSRIRSVENIKKITRAMEMISVVKLKRSQALLDSSREYFLKLESFLKNILCSCEGITQPLLEERLDKQRIALCLLTSDTGLCSAYNHNIISDAENFLDKYETDKIKLVALGRKGFNYFKKKGFNIPYVYLGFNGRFTDGMCSGLLKNLTELFLSKQVNEVYMAYTHIETASKYKTMIEKILNINSDGNKAVSQRTDYIFEPNLNRVLEELIPVYLSSKIKNILLSSFTAEHQARAVAMGEATHNALDLLEGLILQRNKIRQSNITKEIMEVISSSEALKG